MVGVFSVLNRTRLSRDVIERQTACETRRIKSAYKLIGSRLDGSLQPDFVRSFVPFQALFFVSLFD
jgi:hypothetical protein